MGFIGCQCAVSPLVLPSHVGLLTFTDPSMLKEAHTPHGGYQGRYKLGPFLLVPVVQDPCAVSLAGTSAIGQPGANRVHSHAGCPAHGAASWVGTSAPALTLTPYLLLYLGCSAMHMTQASLLTMW